MCGCFLAHFTMFFHLLDDNCLDYLQPLNLCMHIRCCKCAFAQIYTYMHSYYLLLLLFTIYGWISTLPEFLYLEFS